MNKKDFISGLEFSQSELKAMIDLALQYKAGKNIPKYSDKILTLIFANSSLRTRLSFESGMHKLSGAVNVISASDSWQFEYKEGAVMNGDTQEHISEAARVLSRYSDLIGLRKCELITRSGSVLPQSPWSELRTDQPIQQLAKYADKPVINMESNMHHPCQAMADMLTMTEQFGSVAKKKYVLTWAPHIKPLPLATPHSQLLLPSIFGMDVVLTCPSGFELDPEVIEIAKNKAIESGGSVSITNDQKKALFGADVVVAKSWASLKFFGDWEDEAAYRSQFKDWMLTNEKMKLTNNAYFMHCLPVRRNVEVSDEVLDSPRSLIIDEAENRMWAQMAIIHSLL